MTSPETPSGFTAKDPCLPPREPLDPIYPWFRPHGWIGFLAAFLLAGLVLLLLL